MFNDGNSVVDCILRDLSDGGARLQVANSTGLPDRFLLTLEGERGAKTCKVVWRTLVELGVQFS